MWVKKENVQAAINIMKRNRKYGQKLDMSEWQDSGLHKIQNTESGVWFCDCVCSMGGYIAVSSEFYANGDGGDAGPWGNPVLNGLGGTYAIAEWFGISEADAEALTCDRGHEKIAQYRGKKVSDITFGDVIEVLEILRETGSIYSD